MARPVNTPPEDPRKEIEAMQFRKLKLRELSRAKPLIPYWRIAVELGLSSRRVSDFFAHPSQAEFDRVSAAIAAIRATDEEYKQQ